MMNAGKILGVTIEREFETYELTGEDAEKWNQACNSQASLAYVHGVKFPTLPWKTIKSILPNEGATANATE